MMSAVPCWGDIVLPSEKEYRLSRFAECIGALRDKCIALYGTGVNAREIVARFGDGLRIACIVGDAPGEDEFAGVPIVGWEDALRLQPDVVILAAKTGSARAIYERIGAQCREGGLAVRDMYGNDPAELFSPAPATSFADMLDAIDCHDVISIDFLMPGLKHRFPQFTDRISTPLFSSELSWLSRYAYALGKEMIFLSGDVMLRSPKPGVFAFEADCRCAQENGYFRLLRRRYPDSNILHVGIDYLRDYVCPRVYGVDACLITRPLVSAGDGGMPPAVAQTEAERVVERLVSHIDISGKSAAWAYGYRALGPLVTGCCLWLASRARGCNLDGILFAARDTYLLYRAWECLAGVIPGLPAATYYLTSRASAVLPLADRPAMCEYLLAVCEGMRPRDMLARTFGLPESDIQVPARWDVDSDEARLKTLLEHADAIGARARLAMEGQRAYWHESGLEIGGKYAFVQAIAAGTEQLMLHEYAPFHLRGLYLARRPDAQMADDALVESYLPRDFAFPRDQMMRIESLLSSDTPTLIGFAADGTPLLREEGRPDDERRLMREVQGGIMAFVHDYCAAAEPDACTTMRPAFAVRMLQEYDDASIEVSSLNSWTGISQPTAGIPDAIAPDRLGQPQDTRAEPEAARSVHDVLLRLLSAFDAVCTEFGLRYIATHGTLLGALRHGGFIPWDDDLDVAMPRADYERLVALAEAGMFPEPFFLQTPENDPGCFYGGYAKLRDSSTSAVEDDHPSKPFNQGMWIDILPLDNCPDNQCAVEKRQRIIRQWQRILYAQTYGLGTRGLWDASPSRVSAYFIAAGRMSREQLCRLLKSTCMSCRDTGMLTVFAGNYQWTQNNVRYSREDVAAAVRVPFENTSIPVPAHAPRWLEFHYGATWATAPNEEGRISRHDVLLDPNTPYAQKLALLAKGGDGNAR